MTMYLRALVLSFLVAIASSFGEKVGKYMLTENAVLVNGRTVNLPGDIVALCEKIFASDSSDVFSNGGGATSIMFVIDNSTSMFLNLVGNTHPEPKDPDGVRYSVVSDLIDIINQKVPTTEIGLSVFSSHLYFDKSDDALFENIADSKYSVLGGYIPLLELDKEVTVGKNSGKSGYQVLKEYLKTRSYTKEYKGITNNYTNLSYIPQTLALDPLKVQPSGTNVWAGFQAAKEAMQKSSHSKENQFIIFFSDGDQGHIPDGAGPIGFDWDDETSQGAPTTYMVYFDIAGISFPMEDLIELIQTNGYSAKNPNSTFYKMSAGHDQVLQFVSDNVLSEIITNLTILSPLSCQINSIDCQNPWSNNYFTFDSVFPLNAPQTDINEKIAYQRKKIIIENGDTTVQDLGDSTADIAYTVSFNSGDELGDSLEFTYWGRNMNLFSGNSEVLQSDTLSKEGALQIKFSPYRVDSFYDYSNVKVEISTRNATDKETISLNKSGSDFIGTFDLKEGVAVKGDGILQTSSSDSLIFTFRNSNLPLDTLRVSRFYCREFNGIKATSGAYFDTDGDGRVDSVAVAVSGSDLSKYEGAIASRVESCLPAWRKFSVISSSLSGGYISFRVTTLDSIVTAVDNNKDLYSDSDSTELDKNVFMLPEEFVFEDKMAPVIIQADCLDSVKTDAEDILSIKFSEEIETVSENEPFNFITSNGSTQYGAKLSLKTQNGNSAFFTINKLLGGVASINQNDSVWISVSVFNKISDLKSNEQIISNNHRVPINLKLVEEGIAISGADFFDENGDGKVDKIELSIVGDSLIISEHLSEILNSIKLPSYKQFTISEILFDGSKITLSVVQNSSELKTTTDSTDSIFVSKLLLDKTTDLYLLENSFVAGDKMAPVIISEADYFDTITINYLQNGIDTSVEAAVIKCEFSEPLLNPQKEEPLAFYMGGDNNVFKLEFEGCVNNIYTFAFVNIPVILSNDDSVNINVATDNLSDSLHNAQDALKNIKQKINVSHIVNEQFSIMEVVYLDKNADGFIDYVNIKTTYDKLFENDSILAFCKAALENIPERDFKVEDISIHSNNIGVEVTEKSLNKNSGLYDTDIFKSDAYDVSNQLSILKTELSIMDSVAPVIVAASLVDSLSASAKDILRIKFSERMDKEDFEVSKDPFVFYRNGIAYRGYITFKEKIDIATFSFVVDSIFDCESILNGDSININYVANISDTLQNNQSDNRNIHVPISVSYALSPFDVSLNATALTDDEPMHIHLSLSKDSDFPDGFTMSCNIKIYDVVGNMVLPLTPMVYNDSEKRCEYKWDGKNRLHRNVGNSTYLLIAEDILVKFTATNGYETCWRKDSLKRFVQVNR